jgi:serralysin
MSVNERHFCMCVIPKPDVGKTRAALLKEYQWPKGAVINVRFLEGDSGLRERVEAVAKEWSGPTMANLELRFRKTGDADIRIAFKPGAGSWSYLGTYCRKIDKTLPTMNYGWLTPASSDDELRRVVLHEFGHALGLIHEHQNPRQPVQWNKPAVRRDLSGPPNNWDDATIENNIFKKYEPGELLATDLDPNSIMMYPIPKAWTLDGFSAGFNKELSDKDRVLIRDAYPHT